MVLVWSSETSLTWLQSVVSRVERVPERMRNVPEPTSAPEVVRQQSVAVGSKARHARHVQVHHPAEHQAAVSANCCAASSAACTYQALGMAQLHGTASGVHGQPPCQVRMATVTPSSHCRRWRCQHPWLQQQPWHHGPPSLATCSSTSNSQQATLARDVRAMPIKVVTVSKGNSQGATLMASEWSEKVEVTHQIDFCVCWQ